MQHADLAPGQFGTGFGVADPQLHPRQGQAHGARPPVTLIGVRGVHRGFRHPVAFEDPVPRARLEGLVGFCQQRRGTRHEEPHMRRQIAVEPRIVQKPRVEGRHPHHGRRFGQQPQHRLQLEFRQEDQRATSQERHVGRHEKAVRVKDRQRMKQHVIRREPPACDQRLRIRQQVALRQHRPLGAARGPGGVQECCQIIERAGHGREAVGLCGGQIAQAARTVGPQRLENRADTGGDGRHRLGLAGVADEQRRATVAHEIVQLLGRVGGVERQEHDTGLDAGGIERQRLRRFLDMNRNTIPGPKPEACQRIRRAVRHGQERRIAEA